MDISLTVVHDLWKRAAHEPVTVDLKTPARAKAFRTFLYNAVREFKNGKNTSDLELTEAANSVMVSIDKDGRVTLKPRLMDDFVQVTLKALETTGKTNSTDAELDAAFREIQLGDRR